MFLANFVTNQMQMQKRKKTTYKQPRFIVCKRENEQNGKSHL